MSTLRERLLALADDCELIRGDLVLAAARITLEEAAKECSTLPAWCDWEHYSAAIRALRDGLD